MDRPNILFRLLIPVGIAVIAAQVGCEKSDPGEYHTYAESQAADAQQNDASPEKSVLNGNSESSAPRDRSVTASAKHADATTVDSVTNRDTVSEPADSTLADSDASTANLQRNGADATESQAQKAIPTETTQAPTPDEETVQTPAATIKSASESAVNPKTNPRGDGIELTSRSPVVPDSAAPANPDAAALESGGTGVAPHEIKLLVPEQTFKTEGPEQALRVSYDDLDLLKVLNMEPVPEDAVSHFPKWLSALDGQRIRVRGFMYPTFRESGLTGFVLARDNAICCFGRNPKIYDLLTVAMRDGETTDYIQGRPFDVVGVLHIRPEADEGELYQLYEIDDAIVID